ncbi:MAG TPA: restriction endonuclease [Candidatus Wirthbacteria bacterium]|nr:restriction endonuclease [Candidatus Wirthbacteria bacterium]
MLLCAAVVGVFLWFSLERWLFVIIVAGLLALSLGLVVVIKLWRAKVFLQIGLPQIDRMSGLEFEDYLAKLFAARGYKVQQIKNQDDYGVDLVVAKDGQKIGIQAKRYGARKKVDVEGVRAVIAGLPFHQAERGMVVTNSFYTDHAWQTAKMNQVELWDRNRLKKEIRRITNFDSVKN